MLVVRLLMYLRPKLECWQLIQLLKAQNIMMMFLKDFKVLNCLFFSCDNLSIVVIVFLFNHQFLKLQRSLCCKISENLLYWVIAVINFLLTFIQKNFWGALTQPRPDVFGMLQQSGEYFAPNPMLSFFGMDFALILLLEVKTKKIKKRSSSQNLRLLDHVHSIYLAVS